MVAGKEARRKTKRALSFFGNTAACSHFNDSYGNYDLMALLLRCLCRLKRFLFSLNASHVSVFESLDWSWKRQSLRSVEGVKRIRFVSLVNTLWWFFLEKSCISLKKKQSSQIDLTCNIENCSHLEYSIGRKRFYQESNRSSINSNRSIYHLAIPLFWNRK